MGVKVHDVMTPTNDLVSAPEWATMESAKELLRKNKVEKLPLVEKDGRLAGLMTANVKPVYVPSSSVALTF